MEFSIKAWTISSLLARSALVTSTFLMLVASSVTGNKLGVKTMAKLLEKFVKMIEFRVEHCDLTEKKIMYLESILFSADASATSDKNRIRQVSEALCKGGNKRLAVKIASIFESPDNLQHLKIRAGTS